jgi:hypothetical protein
MVLAFFRTVAVSLCRKLTFTHRDADEKKFPALWRPRHVGDDVRSL